MIRRLYRRLVAGRAVFYFDFNSPYAYLAAERIGGLIPDAEWRPFAYPFLLHELGRLEGVLAQDPGPAALEVVSRRAAERALPPVMPPAGWPLETWSLTPLRAALHAGEHGRLKEFSVAAFRKFFAEGLPLTDLDNLRDVARGVGLDPDALDEATRRPEIKQRLKDHTSEALASGITGIPTVAIAGELFWGDDRLEEAAALANE